MKWAALLLAVLLAGCGGENKQAPGSSGHFEGEASKVAAVIGEYQRAFHRADGTHICRELIPEGHRPPRCERAMAQLARQRFYRHVDIEVREVDVHGAKAKAHVLTTAGRHRERGSYSLVKQRGRWRIDVFGQQDPAGR